MRRAGLCRTQERRHRHFLGVEYLPTGSGSGVAPPTWGAGCGRDCVLLAIGAGAGSGSYSGCHRGDLLQGSGRSEPGACAFPADSLLAPLASAGISPNLDGEGAAAQGTGLGATIVDDGRSHDPGPLGPPARGVAATGTAGGQGYTTGSL